VIPHWVTYSMNLETQNYLRSDQPEGINIYSQIRITQVNGIDYLDGCLNRKWNLIGRLQKCQGFRTWFTVRAWVDGELTLILVRRRMRERRLDLYLYPGEIIKNKDRKHKVIQFIKSWTGYSIE
jgi:hypothetical protein